MPKILLVDDSRAIRLELTNALIESGYEVIEAVDGEDGLVQARPNLGIDLIITDYNMPGINGLRMCEEIKKIEGMTVVPIMVLTTHSDSKLKEQGREIGVKVWVVKPIIPVKLLYVVDKLLKAK